MKIELKEYSGVFSFEMSAETVEDAAKLARLGLNATKKISGSYVSAHKDGAFISSLNIEKSRRECCKIKRNVG